MTFPKFVKFEETQDVCFDNVKAGGGFSVESGIVFARGCNENGAPNMFGVRENAVMRLFKHSSIVTIHRPPETKPLGECNPGDVVRCPEGDIGYLLHDPDDHILLRDDLVPIAMYGDHEIAAWSRRLTVTIIGKVVCDG